MGGGEDNSLRFTTFPEEVLQCPPRIIQLGLTATFSMVPAPLILKMVRLVEKRSASSPEALLTCLQM